MTTSVNGSIALTSVDAASLPGTVAGYVVTLSEAGGAAAPAPVAVALDSTSFSLTLEAGTWTASAVAVDASGNALSAAVVSAPLTIVAPVVVMVKIPSGISLTAV